MSPVSVEMQSKIDYWRFRAAEGTLPLEEMIEAIEFLRAGRMSAGASVKKAAATKKAAFKAIPNAEAMLLELDGI